MKTALTFTSRKRKSKHGLGQKENNTHAGFCSFLFFPFSCKVDTIHNKLQNQADVVVPQV